MLSCEDQCGKLDIAVTRQPDCDTQRVMLIIIPHALVSYDRVHDDPGRSKSAATVTSCNSKIRWEQSRT